MKLALFALNIAAWGATAAPSPPVLPPGRYVTGEIRDWNGQTLAAFKPACLVVANPTVLGPAWTNLLPLAQALQISRDELEKRVRPHVLRTNNGRAVYNHYVPLGRIFPSDWQALQSALWDKTRGSPSKEPWTRGVYTRDSALRVYPNGALAAHVLGFRTRSNEMAMAGASGVEKWLDSCLQAQAVPPKSSPAVACHAVLTLRLDVQQVVENALNHACLRYSPRSATALVTEGKTGRILAMACRPHYNGNSANRAPADALRNRVLSDAHEPGGALRFLVAAALNEGLVTPDMRIDTGREGVFRFAGREFRDLQPNGLVTVREIVARPSPIGLARIGILLGDERSYRYLFGFGLGQKTGLLAGESGGMLRPVSGWDRAMAGRVATGYGLAATPLQMVVAFGVIANQGMHVAPVLVERLVDDSNNVLWQAQPREGRQVVTASCAREVARVLTVRSGPDGPSSKAALDGVSVAGCGGSVVTSTGSYGQFIGFCSVQAARICVGVALESASGNVRVEDEAMTVFREIARQGLALLERKKEMDEP